MLKKLPAEVYALLESLILALVLCTLAATVIYFTGLKESLFHTLGTLILIMSVFVGGCHVSKYYGNKGLVRGISLGISFFTLMLIFTVIFNYSMISLKGFIYTLLICIMSGGIGGILGIGLNEA